MRWAGCKPFEVWEGDAQVSGAVSLPSLPEPFPIFLAGSGYSDLDSKRREGWAPLAPAGGLAAWRRGRRGVGGSLSGIPLAGTGELASSSCPYFLAVGMLEPSPLSVE